MRERRWELIGGLYLGQLAQVSLGRSFEVFVLEQQCLDGCSQLLRAPLGQPVAHQLPRQRTALVLRRRGHCAA